MYSHRPGTGDYRRVPEVKVVLYGSMDVLKPLLSVAIAVAAPKPDHGIIYIYSYQAVPVYSDASQIDHRRGTGHRVDGEKFARIRVRHNQHAAVSNCLKYHARSNRVARGQVRSMNRGPAAR